MKKTLRSALCVLLAVLMAASLGATAFAKPTEWISQSHSDIPVIRISGDGEPLYDENGNKVFHYKDILTLFEDDGEEEEAEDDGDTTMQSIVNVLQPFLLDGIANDNWEPYYENLQKEIGELFETSLLDENGNAQYGTGLRPDRVERLERVRHNDQAWRLPDGTKYYPHDRYWFNYDWRLDPIYTAGEFKSFIDDILASTGCTQVGINASCLGTNVVTAYLAVYPEHAAEHIRGIAYDGSVVKGAEMISEVISGKFNIDPAAINRTIKDCEAIGMFKLDSFVSTTLEMLGRTGVLEAVLGVTKEWVYYKIVEGATSALALSTFFTWPNYWACVSEEDYPTAMQYVFGPEGSEKRAKYAGLIEKIENYDRVVRQHVDEILTTTVENGVHFGVISKYGFQNMPVCETNYLVADQFASVRRSAFGATTGTIYEDLSDEYIESRIAAGYEDYISPDRQIDASTCLFPESTWFIKGSSHSNWSDWEIRLMYEIATSKEPVTVGNGCWPSRFVVYEYPENEDAKDSDGEIFVMTEANCDTENWEADASSDYPTGKYGKLFVGLSAFIKWLYELICKLFKI